MLPVRGVKGAGHDLTSSGLWDSSCEAGVPVSFWRGQETARWSQRRELGLPQSLAAPQVFPTWLNPHQPFLLPSALVDVRTQKHRRREPTCQRHRGDLL